MTDLTPQELKGRLKTLRLFGLINCWDQIANKPWLREVLSIEEGERQKRSVERRLKNSRVASFTPMADFDWTWPKKLDRKALDELIALDSLKTGNNAVLVGPNGVGKTKDPSHFHLRHDLIDLYERRFREVSWPTAPQIP